MVKGHITCANGHNVCLVILWKDDARLLSIIIMCFPQVSIS